MSISEITSHYGGVDVPFRFTPPSSPTGFKKNVAEPLQLNTNTIFTHKREISRQSSIDSHDSDSDAASPLTATFDSPSSLCSSPTFAPVNENQFQSASSSTTTTNNNALRTRSLPVESVNSVQCKTQTSARGIKPARPWFVRRALSQYDVQLESEMRSGGIEGLGLHLFEPRPRQTIICRHPTQGGAVLDSISEVLHGGR